MHEPLRTAGWSRRQIFRAARALGLGALVPGAAHAAQPAARAVGAPVTPLSGRDLYTSLGVRPIINARGTLTIITVDPFGSPFTSVSSPARTETSHTWSL